MDYCAIAPGHPWHGPYHDLEYGYPTTDETVLCERLALEVMQAGLTWQLVLQRREGLRAAFDGFRVDRLVAYGDDDVARLLSDARIIRNRLKVTAIVQNAHVLRDLRESHGGFAAWLAAHHPRALPDWVTLFRSRFRFCGPEIVSEFLMSIGYLGGAHRSDCPVYAAVAALRPPWLQTGT